MRRALLVIALVVAFPLAATAEACVQSDGQPGVFYNTEGSDDDRCLTAAEYQEMFSVDNLADAGVVTVVADNGDGTVAVDYALGGSGTLISEALDRPVAANPSEFDSAPTVREVLFPFEAGFSLLPTV